MARRRLARLAAALAFGAAATGTGYAIDAATADARDALGPGVASVEIGIQHSRFSTRSLRVHEGTLVEFELRNDDPIAHELVVGDEHVHRAHEQGTERRHPPRPGEVSVDAGAAATTFYVFDEPGTYEFACHLPGHVAFGMVGEIEVLPA